MITPWRPQDIGDELLGKCTDPVHLARLSHDAVSVISDLLVESSKTGGPNTGTVICVPSFRAAAQPLVLSFRLSKEN
jgi:hypothetical protein